MNEMLKLLKKQLEAGEWVRESDYTIRRNDMKLWVSNGASYFTGHNCEIDIPWFYRGTLWKAYKKGLTKQALELISKDVSK